MIKQLPDRRYRNRVVGVAPYVLLLLGLDPGRSIRPGVQVYLQPGQSHYFDTAFYAGLRVLFPGQYFITYGSFFNIQLQAGIILIIDS